MKLLKSCITCVLVALRYWIEDRSGNSNAIGLVWQLVMTHES
jgi:hypothetical protein